MAAGDLITSNCQQELRGVLLGKGTVWDTEPPGVTGLGEPPVKKNDTPLAHAAGQYLGRDYPDLRILTIPYFTFAKADANTAGARLVTLKGVWASSETDIVLHLREPGFGHFSVTGRPRGLIEDRTLGYTGFIRALATFECGDPTITTVAP